MTILSKEEKITIINSRIRGLEHQQYSFQVDLLVENAKATPNQDSIDTINESLEEISNQMLVLNQELTRVDELEE